MNLLEGARTGALLLDARDTGGLAHHAALADEDDVTVGELLLELGLPKEGMNGEHPCQGARQRGRGGHTSRVRRPWILWKALIWGTGTKMTCGVEEHAIKSAPELGVQAHGWCESPMQFRMPSDRPKLHFGVRSA